MVKRFLSNPALFCTSLVSRSNLSTFETVDQLQLIFLAITRVEYASLTKATATAFFLIVNRAYGDIREKLSQQPKTNRMHVSSPLVSYSYLSDDAIRQKQCIIQS